MSFDYSFLAKTAGGLIDRFGTTVFMSNPVQSEDDPWLVVGTGVAVGVKAVRLDSGEETKSGDSLETGGDISYIIDGTSIPPEVSSKITDRGKTYTVYSVSELTPGDTVMYYKVSARQGV